MNTVEQTLRDNGWEECKAFQVPDGEDAYYLAKGRVVPAKTMAEWRRTDMSAVMVLCKEPMRLVPSSSIRFEITPELANTVLHKFHNLSHCFDETTRMRIALYDALKEMSSDKEGI